jgi:Na+/H+ antiporter NhaD/arsenite permease-like protein
MDWMVWGIFLLTYIGVAIGGIPGLALDRTGISLLGAIGMVVARVLTTQEALESIHTPTILLLYALMVISAQFKLSGFYTETALRLTSMLGRPRRFLLAVMASAAVLSAFLTNDIICLTFTPILCASIQEAGLNPIPYLLGLVFASNIGSAATIIGNPQNMLLGQVGRLFFGRFSLWCLTPVLFSLLAAYGVLLLLYRKELSILPLSITGEKSKTWPRFNRHQTGKGFLVVGLLLVLFFTRIPRELSAIVLAGFLLCSRRMKTRSLLGLVDWHLITLFCALFIVIRGLEITRLPQLFMEGLAVRGLPVTTPVNLVLFSTALSNLVSNVPATMLLVKFLNPSVPMQWYLAALSTTFAGNLITIGSIANLIVIEGARDYGVEIRFGQYARAGIPVTLFSLLSVLVWVSLFAG